VVTAYTVNNRQRSSVYRDEQRRIPFAVHELILRKANGRDWVAMAKSLYGRLLHLRRTNPGAADGLDRLLAAAEINLRRLAFPPPTQHRGRRSVRRW
jgi:hypothetical protein